MGKAEYKVKGGKLIRIKLDKEGNKIEGVKITGDFFLHPEEVIEELERSLKGQPLREPDLRISVRSTLENMKATMLGASPEDLVRCIMMAGEEDV